MKLLELYIDEGICTRFNVSTPVAISKTEVHPLITSYLPMVTNKLHGIERNNNLFGTLDPKHCCYG